MSNEDFDNNCIKNAEARAWEYFKYHAEQRIVLFRYYLTLITALSAGYIFLLQDYRLIYLGGACLAGFLMLVLSNKFLMLDKRNIELIQYSKNAIFLTESTLIADDSTSKLAIFTNEQNDKIE